MITLHGLNGTVIRIKPQHVIMIHAPMDNTPAGAGALVYLSNAMQWTVKESVAEVEKLVGAK